MKTVIKIFTAFLYFHSLSRVSAYFVPDDNPNAGYVAELSSISPYKNKVNGHKKYFIGNNNQKYLKLVNERAVDSHFTVLKTPPKTLGITENQNYNKVDNNKLHENAGNYMTGRQRINPRENVISNPEEHDLRSSTKDNTQDVLQDKEKTTPSDSQTYSLYTVNSYSKKENLNNMLDKKYNFVAINEHRSQISKEQKAININNNQETVHQTHRNQQKLPVSTVKDKILHKASTNNDRSNQKVFINSNDKNQKKSSLNSQKRDTVNNPPIIASKYTYVASNSIPDSIRKYINTDINNYNEYKKNIIPRIGNHEEIVDVNDKPYALFYRMNPEHLDEQEVMVENPLEEANGAFNDKATWNYENQEPAKAKTKRAYNVKLHKYNLSKSLKTDFNELN